MKQGGWAKLGLGVGLVMAVSVALGVAMVAPLAYAEAAPAVAPTTTTTIANVSKPAATLAPVNDRATEAAELPDRAMGQTNAPVTIIEYASLTCHHCADFHNDILPKLKETYIDKGKVKLIFRDFPLDGVALRAAAVARCMPESSYQPYLKLLFKSQAEWAGSPDPVKLLANYAKLGGLDSSDATECANSEKLLDAIAAARQQAEKLHKIEATPSFIFNDGADKISGAVPYEQFAAKIDALLAATPPTTATPASPSKTP